jgi:hypothetical protein
LADLLNPASLKVSYNKLLTNAYSFALATKDGKSATQKWFDLVDGMMFYMDNGDKITFSTDEELTAFLLDTIANRGSKYIPKISIDTATVLENRKNKCNM